ncbi:Endonuclease 8 1 [Botrimarina colliarenosi]|uniref:DNA-(apurinic or apyrimidinic site) lyase n=1 Tax=Botrimarina colliarenosi TaxID=2528001 RepID=A0A5C6AFL6_9BACT|nr:DNA-formamidopyrimidine glycosylase family protein [Botrimarina colliarenosi]TWT97013.1 Endonuclease 8 1 [Botrimarina colliarenosi]
MPEGHTLHRVARDHRRLFVGQQLTASSPQERFAEGAGVLSGRRLEGVEAVGKHLFYHWAPKGRSKAADVLHIHLGLYGKFRLHKKRHEGAWPEPRGAVRLRIEGPDAAFDLNGPNRCELIDTAGYEAQLARLGPDPLRDDDPERAWRRISKSKTPIGPLLMNQEVIAGVGNIYRCESLHLLGIHPERAGKDLDRSEFDALWRKLVELMRIGVKHNRILIADPALVGKPRSRMTREEGLRIYKKANCPDCGSAIDQWTMAGRKVFACTTCQD